MFQCVPVFLVLVHAEKSRARVNGPKSCRRPVVSLSCASKSHRVSRP